MGPQRSGGMLVRATSALIVLGAMATSSPIWPQGMEPLGFMEDRSKGFEKSVPDTRASRYVRISHAGAISTTDGPALHVRVTNIADEPIQVEVKFDAPGRDADCSEAADLDPDTGQRYVCPQATIRPGITYPVTVEVRSPGKRWPIERIRRSYRFGKENVTALAGRGARGLDG